MTKEKFETYLRTYNLPSKFEKFVNDDKFMKYQIGRILYYSKEPLSDLTIKSGEVALIASAAFWGEAT